MLEICNFALNVKIEGYEYKKRRRVLLRNGMTIQKRIWRYEPPRVLYPGKGKLHKDASLFTKRILSEAVG